ncbi:MAG: VOC family protein [Nocardioides sp.]|nr:VOC family protein [Nocardioides sp.]
MSATFSLAATVIGAPDPRGLAEFYCTLLGWAVWESAPDWVRIGPRSGTGGLSFQLEESHVPPAWPAGPGDQQMQVHLDIAVSNLASGVAAAQGLGASLADQQPQPDVRVLLDPAGHPFCLFAPSATG